MMKKNFKSNIFLFLFICFVQTAFAQYTIKGRVTDAGTNEPLGFVNVFVKGTKFKSTTDFDGNYSITINSPVTVDSLTASNLGYKPKKKPFIKNTNQVIDFQLESVLLSTREVVIRPRENTSYEMVKKAVANKKLVSRDNLKTYQAETYRRLEVDIDQISGKLRKTKPMREIATLLDSVHAIKGEDGKPVLPFYVSEKAEDVYVQNKPSVLHKNYVKGENIKGFGIDEGTFLQQIIETSFIEYDFNQNYIRVVNKDFASPIGDSWKLYYDYYISDSMFIGKDWCFKLEVMPKNKLDLAFTGHIWIADSSWAIKRLDLTVDKTANLNFIDQIKIKQELEPTEVGVWFPARTRVLIDVEEPTDSTAGLIAKFYLSNRNLQVNKEYPPRFFSNPLEKAPDADYKDAAFWDLNRHEKLTQNEKNVFKMIDTIKHLPTVKSYIEIIDIAINGYYHLKYIDLGPYPTMYSFNNVEGSRFRLGFKTNQQFSKFITLRGHLAYGTRDKAFKYGASATLYLSRKKWTTLSISHQKDVEQVGFINEFGPANALFAAFTRIGTLRRPYWHTETNIRFENEVIKGILPAVYVKLFNYDPIANGVGNNPFEFINENNEISNSFNTTEIGFNLRLSRKETWLNAGNDRRSIGSKNWPILTLNYGQGFKGVLNGDFNYKKYSAVLNYSLKLGWLGYSNMNLTSALTDGVLPYPALRVHLGNQSIFFNKSSFNLMNFFEYVSDKFVSYQLNHHFEGIVFNKIPLIKKWKWREIASANLLWGGISKSNISIVPNQFTSPQFYNLNNTPYIELGYGIENIFKFLRIEMLHRVTYLNTPYKINRVGIRLSAEVTL